MPGRDASAPRLTRRGVATRDRILSAACDLIYAQGVGGTSLDDVMAASGTGRSQLYHYFSDKDALIAEVVRLQIDRLLTEQRALLDKVDSFRGLRRWRDAEVVDARARRGAHGCPIGSLASELSEHSDELRELLAAAFGSWQLLLADALRRMRDREELSAGADPEPLAAGLMAALQGGLLLAQATRDPARVAGALDMALAHLETFRRSPEPAP